MAYAVIDVSQDLNKLIYDDSHVTLFTTFEYNGTPVDVVSPTFILKNSQGQSVSVTILKPIQKDADTQNVIGKYIVTFLTQGLSAGNYTAEFAGTYNGNDVSSSTVLELFEQPRTQYLIDLLRGALSGKYNAEVPRQYYTFDPTKKQWQDGELFDSLERSVDAINNIIPITDFNLDSIPCVNYLMLGSQLYALTNLAVLEDVNYFDITVPVKVVLYKGDKIKDLARFIKEQFQEPLLKWKRYWFLEHEVVEQAIVMKRVPIRLLRPVCMFPESRVMMSDGCYRYIKDIQIGDMVKTGYGTSGIVEYVTEKNHKNIANVYYDNDVLSLSQEHRLLISNKNVGWKKVKNFKKGDKLCRLENNVISEVTIKDVKLFNNKHWEKLYDITVSNGGSFLTNNRVISHNSDNLFFHSIGW